MPFVENNGIKINYVVEGHGPPIVMLHASMGSYAEWHYGDYINALKDEYQLILIDLRGHGQSDKPKDIASYSSHEFTSDIIAVLDKLKITKAHCWGYSFGGSIAFFLSRDYPDRFHSFIIGGAWPQGFVGEELKKHNHVRELLKQGADGLLIYLKERGDVITPEGEKGIRAMDFDVINAWSNSEDLYGKVDDHLPKLDIPFLFYAGEKDDWNPYPYLVDISKKMKNAKTILFPDVGHDVHYRKGVVLPHVKEFLINFNK
ncbi:MAG: alpha/beta hydrolase [Asgard group archaeon]|nr:alpha/beta hydrolase [Asgard group archaeon]